MGMGIHIHIHMRARCIWNRRMEARMVRMSVMGVVRVDRPGPHMREKARDEITSRVG